MRHKLWETFVIATGLIGTLILDAAVVPSLYGFGITESGNYPMAVIIEHRFRIGITFVLIAICLQTVTLWKPELLKLVSMIQEKSAATLRMILGVIQQLQRKVRK